MTAQTQTPPTADTAPGAAKRGPGRPPKMEPPPTPDEVQTVTPPKGPDAPPAAPKAKAPTGRKDSAPKRSPGRPPKMNVGAKVGEAVESIGAMMTVAGAIQGNDQIAYDGRVLTARAADIGAIVTDLANDNPGIQRALERMFKVSGWGKVGMTLAQVVIPIAACHGVVPVELGVPFYGDIGAPPKRPERPKVAPRPNSQPATNGARPTTIRTTPDPMAGVSDSPSHPDLPGWPADVPLPGES